MFNDLSLQYPSNEAWAIKKKKRKDGMPKKHDPKKMDTSMSMKKRNRRKKDIYIYRYIYIAMSSCYPNKGERDPQKEYFI